MSTPEATRRACEALYQAMAELDNFDDRLDLASPVTRGTFKQCYSQFVDLAVAKGFISPPRHSEDAQGSPEPDIPRGSEEELAEVRFQKLLLLVIQVRGYFSVSCA
jgi:hypothetical protein